MHPPIFASHCCEIKKDLHVADEQLKVSMEKGKVAAEHAGKEIRKELKSDPERR